MSAESLESAESKFSRLSLPERYLFLAGKETPRPISIKDELEKGHRILILARQGNVGKELEKIVILDLFPSGEDKVGMESIVIDAEKMVTRENCRDLIKERELVRDIPQITLDPDQVGYRRVYTQEGWNHKRTGHAEQCRWGELFWTPVDNKTPRGERVHIDLEIKGLTGPLAEVIFGNDLTDDYIWSVIPYNHDELLPTAVRMPQPVLLKMAA